MKVSCIQLDMLLGRPDVNYPHAEELIRRTAEKEKPDVILLPELWDVGFFPKENLEALGDKDCARVIKWAGSLAKELGTAIIAGSVANLCGGKVYNTACVFDRTGSLIAQYDKTHLFTPMGEHHYFAAGNKVCRFTLDGHSCGLVICYDIRFPELTRTLTVPGLDILFVVSQWPDIRIPHLRVLTQARAIENQMYLALCNSCGKAGGTVYGGSSAVIDPWGTVLCEAGAGEEVVTAACDFSVNEKIRASMHIFADRRPELYKI